MKPKFEKTTVQIPLDEYANIIKELEDLRKLKNVPKADSVMMDILNRLSSLEYTTKSLSVESIKIFNLSIKMDAEHRAFWGKISAMHDIILKVKAIKWFI